VTSHPGPQPAKHRRVACLAADSERDSAVSVLRLPEGESADFSQGEVYFIGNATTLIRFGGITILTDPAFLHKSPTCQAGST
jgi:hypothetical protein